MYALAVGQGDSTILICPENQDLFILDMGSTSSSGGQALDQNYVKDMIEEYVTDHPTAHINIAVSHADADHYNWFENVLSDPAVDRVIDHVLLGGDEDDYSTGFITWAKTFAGFSMINDEYECYGNDDCEVNNMYDPANPTDFPQLCSRNNIKSDVVFNAVVANFQTSGTTPSKNAQSLVLVIKYAKFSVMLPGDFETAEAQNDLYSYYAGTDELDVSMYKVSHHGASTKANFDVFLKAVNPIQAFVSSSAPELTCNGGYGHPRCDAMERVIDNAPSLRTLPQPLHYDFECCTPKPPPGVVYTQPTWTTKDIHMTCPGSDVKNRECSSLKFLATKRAKYANVWYIPVV